MASFRERQVLARFSVFNLKGDLFLRWLRLNLAKPGIEVAVDPTKRFPPISCARFLVVG